MEFFSDTRLVIRYNELPPRATCYGCSRRFALSVFVRTQGSESPACHRLLLDSERTVTVAHIHDEGEGIGAVPVIVEPLKISSQH